VTSAGPGLAGEMSPKTRRSDFEISASILESLLHGPLTMHAIFSTAHLNLWTAKKYVEAMKSQGLIQSAQGRFVTYSITEKGINWLNTYKDLVGDKEVDWHSPTDFESPTGECRPETRARVQKTPLRAPLPELVLL
jgi:predicted transcriptional regulator